MQQFPKISLGIDEETGEEKWEDNSVIKVDLFKKKIGSPFNMIFTKDGLYNQNEPWWHFEEEKIEYENVKAFPETGQSDKIYVAKDTGYLYKWTGTSDGGSYLKLFDNLLEGTDYKYVDGFIDCKSVPCNDPVDVTGTDIYAICSKENNVYYWRGNKGEKCRKLEGLYNPGEWVKNHKYNYGDTVAPSDNNYTGYIYMCITSGGGISGTQEPAWEKNMKDPTKDGDISWQAVGSFKVEGTSAKDVKARFIEQYKGFTFIANLEEDNNEYPSRLRWSQFQNPRLWHKNEDQSGMAGYVDVDDVDGEIMAIRKLNDILVVYKEKGIIAVTFTGGEDTVFSKELITTKTGLIASGAIIELPHSHIFIGDDNIYEFNGSSIVPIGDQIKDYFFSTLNPVQRDRIMGYYDEEIGDVMIIYDKVKEYDILNNVGIQEEYQSKLASSKNRGIALTFNITTKTWSKREMYATAIGKFCQTKNRIIEEDHRLIKDVTREQIDSSFGLKDKIINVCGDEKGNLYRIEGTADVRDEDGKFYGYVVSKTHHMEDPGHIKRLLRIQFHIVTSPGSKLVVEVGTGWNSEAHMDKWETHNLDLRSPKPPFVDVDLSARYFQIKFGTENNGEYFKILGYTLYYQTRGDE